jgi:hypothetical protein
MTRKIAGLTGELPVTRWFNEFSFSLQHRTFG